MPMVYHLRHAILDKVKKREDHFPEIQGRQEVKKDVLRALLSGSHPYLVSEEGTGKTRLAKSLTKLLPPIPVIKGCPYNDDPWWPKSLLCPRCRMSQDPQEEYGIELLPGERRFSRIQGNEYTNEAKLLGIKDIQAIAHGKSPSDPQVFSGTGVFKANRGVLFVDELPAIRTKVQVLLHPILEEKKAVLEEYNWGYPLDLVLIATGNPQGFAHINEVPRPLLDRLELIYVDLPEEEVEKDIILREKFSIRDSRAANKEQKLWTYPTPKELERRVIAPWWTLDLINAAVRHSRICRWLEKRASIRGTIKALDHTYASVELESRDVANLKDAYDGLRLALRSRLGLRSDLVDLDSPKKTLEKIDRVVEDLLWNAVENFDFNYEADKEAVANELTSLFSAGLDNLTLKLRECEELSRALEQIKNMAKDRMNPNLSDAERHLYAYPEKASCKVQEEYSLSALETIANVAWHRGVINEGLVEGRVFLPKRIKTGDL